MSRKPTDTAGPPTGLPPALLRPECDPDTLGFATTATLRSTTGLVGQDRATDAIKLSAEIDRKDFNLYVLGREGTGRHTAVNKLLSKAAAKRPMPCDWVYVNNFVAPHKPEAMKLPSGSAATLKLAMQRLVDDLAIEIPALFESEEYQTQRRAIEEEFGKRHEETIAEFAEHAQAEKVALLRTPMGFMLTATVDGKPIKPEDYEALSPEQRAESDAKIERLQEELASVLQRAPHLEREHRQTVEALHARMAERAVSLRIQEVQTQFPDDANIAAYLENVRSDMISNAELFLISQNGSKEGPFPEVIRKYHLDPHFDRYAVNIMVSHGDSNTASAPIVRGSLPSLNNLTGRIEHMSEMGTLATNFTLIKPGALHRANGGYLVMDAHRLLAEPYAWDALKRCLQNQSIAITSLADRLSLTSTTTLEPDPIPLDVRVVLIGDRRLHMLLTLLDPEFGQLFKLQADFEDDLPRSAKNTRALARIWQAMRQKKSCAP